MKSPLDDGRKAHLKDHEARYDVIVIGAGIVGAFLAFELAKTRWRTAVLEKSTDVALGATKANSGIIHAGYDPEPRTLKARLNVEGAQLYASLSRQLSFGYRKTGSLVTALTEEETFTLEKLMERGLKNGVRSLSLLSADQALRLEPNLNRQVRRALLAESTAVIDPWDAAIAALECAVDNGVTLRLSTEVTQIKLPKAAGEDIVLSTRQGVMGARVVINAAGIHAARLSAMASGGTAEFQLVPKRGQYFVLDKSAGPLVQRVIYPAPTAVGKGVLVIPTVHGNLMVGPDNEILENFEAEVVKTTSEGLAFVRQRAQQLVPSLPFHLGIANFSGIRAEPSENDFILRASKLHPRWIHAAGIKSPGLSAAPAIAKYLMDLIQETLSDYQENSEFVLSRRPRQTLAAMSPQERRLAIAENPLFAHIVCRCELVSEAEVVDCIRRSVGARTLNGVKRRVRPGAGRCQGGFCAPRILEILARELGLKETELLLEHPGSQIVFDRGGAKDEGE